MAEMPPVHVNVETSLNEPELQEFFNPNLPLDLQKVSIKFYDIAQWMIALLPPGAQRAQGLWDLLRSKDCAVRAYRHRNARVGHAEESTETIEYMDGRTREVTVNPIDAENTMAALNVSIGKNHENELATVEIPLEVFHAVKQDSRMWTDSTGGSLTVNMAGELSLLFYNPNE